MAESSDALERPFQVVSIAPTHHRIEYSPTLNPPLTSFVGREEIVATLSDLLEQPDARLVTLTGPGGIGKTRLALHLASERASTTGGQVTRIDLSPLTQPGLVVPTIARSFGILEAPGTPIIEQLQTFLQERDQLLVLDNFEQVMGAAPLVDSLLRTTAITILVTSREPLRLSAERVIDVPPLSLPGEPPKLDELARSHAIRLFVDRAEAARADFQVDEENASTVSEIVRRLDGLPLAIELAAARMAHVTPATLLSRLDHRLPLLTGGSRDLPPRHQTLRGAIAWSVDLLNSDERRLFAQLSVFIDGWTLDAAEAVYSAGDGAPQNVLDGLASLTAKSLIHHQPDSTGASRFRMLETIREYAMECLQASGEGDSLRSAHASWCTSHAEQHEFAEVLTHGERRLVPLEAEIANLRGALEWLRESGEIGAQVRLAAAMRHLWIDLGFFEEGRRWLAPARTHDGIATSDRARALVTLGIVDIYLGLPQEAEASLTAALAIFRDHGDALNQARTLIGLGAHAVQHGDLDRGASYLEECLAVAATIEDQRLSLILSGWALINLADISRVQGNFERGGAQLDDALVRMRAASHIRGIVGALNDLGDLARHTKDVARALRLYREALTMGLDAPGSPALTFALEGVGMIAIELGQSEHGVRLLGAAARMRDRLGLRYRGGENSDALDLALARAHSDLDDATFVRCWDDYRGLLESQAISVAVKPFESESSLLRPSLTPREHEVLTLLAAGRSNPGIAAALFISVRTAENHVAHILHKFGASTRSAAVMAATEVGLIAPPVEAAE